MSRHGGGGGGDRAERGERGSGGGKRTFFRRRKVCKFTAEHIEYIDYKDVKLIQQYILERAKILPRRISGTSARHQRMLAQAIKRARHLALIPFTAD